jgi:hypothetical protein
MRKLRAGQVIAPPAGAGATGKVPTPRLAETEELMDRETFDALARTLARGLTRRGAVTALVGLGLARVPAAAGARTARTVRQASADDAPEPVNLDFVDATSCPFSIHVVLTGKTKAIDLPEGRQIVTSPGLDVDFTNLASGKEVTLSITGASHVTTQDNGDIVVVATGRNILFDPVAEPHFALTRGRFTWAVDKNGTLIQPRSGKGKLTDVCELLA